MILISGATGELGRLVVDALLTRVPAATVVAGVRDPAKAADLAARGVTVRRFDYDAPETLGAALVGVDRLLLISGNAIGQRVSQHAAVIAAAKAAGVQLLAYTSILGADRSSLGLAAEHAATEQAIAASGLPAVILRNGWYAENYTGSLQAALAHGVLAGAAAAGKVAPAARKDFAEAAAIVLTTEGHAGRTYELAGDTSLSLPDVAAIIAAAGGRPVVYQDMPEAAYAGFLASVGVPKAFAELLADSDVGLSRGDLDDDSGALRQLIGRPTTPFADVVTQALRGV